VPVGYIFAFGIPLGILSVLFPYLFDENLSQLHRKSKEPKKSEEAKIIGEIDKKLDIEVETRNPPKAFCDVCGAKLLPHYKFCPGCQKPLKPNVAPPVKAQVKIENQIKVSDDRFTIHICEEFNDIQNFIEKELVRMEQILELGAEQLSNKVVSVTEFIEWAKAKQDAVRVLNDSAEEQIKKLGNLRDMIEQRIAYANSNMGRLALEAAEAYSGLDAQREFIAEQKRYYELQREIAEKLLGWHASIEKTLKATKRNVETRFWQAIKAAIPTEAMMPVKALPESLTAEA
jgi:DNA repair exonuclease SbcCD ATPase subunit